jgi:hypothetical protein
LKLKINKVKLLSTIEQKASDTTNSGTSQEATPPGRALLCWLRIESGARLIIQRITRISLMMIWFEAS